MFILYILKLSHKSKLQQIELNRAYETPDMITDIKPTKSSVKFDDVAGIDMVKEELEEIIDYYSLNMSSVDIDAWYNHYRFNDYIKHTIYNTN